MNKKIGFISLGCSKNLVDTEVIAGTLLTSGRTLAFEPDEADLYVINTCAFIPAARDEAVAHFAHGNDRRAVLGDDCLSDHRVRVRYAAQMFYRAFEYVFQIFHPFLPAALRGSM